MVKYSPLKPQTASLSHDMKTFFQTITLVLLSWLARRMLKKYHPLMVGVTGSVGKSSTKEAIALVLAKDFSVCKSEGNYNNELGLPLAILGEKSPGRNIFAWVLLFVRSLARLLVKQTYPEILVLEMGIDRPRDMESLLKIARPTIGVVTQISESHLEFFETLGNIAKEKGRLIASLPEEGTAILNADDERVLKMKERTKAKVITYGLSLEADVHAENILFLQEGSRIDGMSFKLSYQGKTIPVRLPENLGKHSLSAILAAVAVGIALKMNLVDIAERLLQFRTLPGRLKILSGRDEMRLIDDTYNASIASTKAALAVLKEIIAPRRVVILGDMLEIGETAILAHRGLAEAVVGSGANVFVGVGKYMQALADTLHGTSFPEKNIYAFRDGEIALRALPDILRPGDTVLLKGSRGMRMEKIVEALLLHPEEDRKLLCCQSKSWQSKPFVPPAEWKD